MAQDRVSETSIENDKGVMVPRTEPCPASVPVKVTDPVTAAVTPLRHSRSWSVPVPEPAEDDTVTVPVAVPHPPDAGVDRMLTE